MLDVHQASLWAAQSWWAPQWWLPAASRWARRWWWRAAWWSRLCRNAGCQPPPQFEEMIKKTSSYLLADLCVQSWSAKSNCTRGGSRPGSRGGRCGRGAPRRRGGRRCRGGTRRRGRRRRGGGPRRGGHSWAEKCRMSPPMRNKGMRKKEKRSKKKKVPCYLLCR